MRNLLLTASIILVSCSVNAQQFEAGINGGISSISLPMHTNFSGDKQTLQSEGSVRFLYNISDYWQVGGDVNMCGKWQTTGTIPTEGTYGQYYGRLPITYVFADPATTISAQFNRVIPFYSDADLSLVQSQLYGGISVGGIFTANDGKTVTAMLSQYEYPYTAQFDYENGKGYSVGAQIGYSYFIGYHFGLNIEAATRYASIYTSDARYGHGYQHFDLFNSFLTFGLRYKFGEHNDRL